MSALAAAAAVAPARRVPLARAHASEDDYRGWVEAHIPACHARWERMRAYRRFTERWPDLEGWFAEPLPVRLGFTGAGLNASGRGPGHQAAGYLVYLSLVRGVGLDYGFLLGRMFARPFDPSAGGRGLGVDLALLERYRERMRTGLPARTRAPEPGVGAGAAAAAPRRS